MRTREQSALFRLGAFAAVLLLGASAAQAFQVDSNGTTATAIRNLEWNGAYWDVTFRYDTAFGVYGGPPPDLPFDATREEEAAALLGVINAALNTVPALTSAGAASEDRIHIAVEDDETYGVYAFGTVVSEYYPTPAIWDYCERPSDGCVLGTTIVGQNDIVTWADFVPAGGPPSGGLPSGGDLAGIDAAGGVFISTDMTAFRQIQGTINSSLVSGDFNNNGMDGLAGLDAAGRVFYSPDLLGFSEITAPAAFKQLVSDDFNNDGLDDLAGLDTEGRVFYTLNRSTWTQIPGRFLSLISAGDLVGDDRGDLAGIGLNKPDAPYYILSTQAGWIRMPGALSSMVAVGDLNNDGRDDLGGLNPTNQPFYSLTLKSWTWLPVAPPYNSLAGAGDLNGDGNDDLAGIDDSTGLLSYTVDLGNWNPIPGVQLNSVVGAVDLNGDGKDDLAGATPSGLVYYTIDLINWINIPGTLSSLVSGNFN